MKKSSSFTKFLGVIGLILILAVLLYFAVPGIIAATSPTPTPTATPTSTPLPPTATLTPTATETPTVTPDLTKNALETQVFQLAQTQKVVLTSAAQATEDARTPEATDSPNSRFTNTPEGTPPATQGPPFTVNQMPSSVKLGKNATVTITTLPGAFCYLTYWTPGGRLSSASGTGGKTANASGVCSWTWQIADKDGTGNGTVAISAAGYNQSFIIVITE